MLIFDQHHYYLSKISTKCIKDDHVLGFLLRSLLSFAKLQAQAFAHL